MVTRLPGCKCPGCGKDNDAATAIDKEEVKPKPGDISICFYCGSILTYQEDMNLRFSTAEEMKELKEQSPQAYIQLFRAQVRIQSKIRSN